MSTAQDKQVADDARSALVSDIHELKDAGQAVVSQAQAKLPWVIGGVVGAIAIGSIAYALTPKRRSLPARRPTLLGKAVRAAALSAIGIVARRLVTRAVDKALPPPDTKHALPPTEASRA